jgi:uncharacterized protein (TIRG00374 family)
MKPRHALLGFALVTTLYVGALIWADSRNQVFSALPRLLQTMPILVALSFLSYVIRYARWHWLLMRAGSRTHIGRGFLSYIAGFAFTATPGKVGELVRIRYLLPQGVPASRVLAAFVYERAFDMIVVLILASLAITRSNLFVLALIFVVALVATLVMVALHPGWLTRLATLLAARGLDRAASTIITLRDGLATCRTWATPLDVVVALVAGGVAWCITSASFVWLLWQLDVSIPTLSAFAIFPLAMLAGAASMLPGGIGSTEAVIIATLLLFDVPVGTATLAAVGIRLSSLWFAILSGLSAVAALELSSPARNKG